MWTCFKTIITRAVRVTCEHRIAKSFLLLTSVIFVLSFLKIFPVDSRGIQFIGLSEFSHFEKSLEGGETVFISDEIVSRVTWNELIASWNAELSAGAYMKIEVRAIYGDRKTKFYSMGIWSGEASQHRRESILNQKDSDGDVNTDTLLLNKGCKRVQLRLIFGGKAANESKLKFIGLCLQDTKAKVKSLKPERAAWGKTIPVPERSQMDYPNGKVLCSPTTVSMIMTYWSQQLKRPDIDRDVPAIVTEIFDPNWDGTGNWAFNMAYAGSFPGMRAYVTRMSDVSELEDWIASGIPVGVSLDYNKLRGKEGPSSGHLVVCVGFTDKGDVIVNDPGTSKNVRKTFPRKNLIAAWAHSHNAVYLIYPEKSKTAKDRFGHWESRTTAKLLDFGRSAGKLEGK